jgi:hypothetical protein
MLAHHGPEAALHAVTDNRGPNRTTDDKAYLRRLGWANPAKAGTVRGSGRFGYQQMPGQRCASGAAPSTDRAPEVGGARHPRLPRQHLRLPCGTSGAELLAALAAARCQDRPARPGTHAQPEAMGLCPPAVVRLERTLAHWSSR